MSCICGRVYAALFRCDFVLPKPLHEGHPMFVDPRCPDPIPFSCVWRKKAYLHTHENNRDQRLEILRRVMYERDMKSPDFKGLCLLIGNDEVCAEYVKAHLSMQAHTDAYHASRFYNYSGLSTLISVYPIRIFNDIYSAENPLHGPHAPKWILLSGGEIYSMWFKAQGPTITSPPPEQWLGKFRMPSDLQGLRKEIARIRKDVPRERLQGEVWAYTLDGKFLYANLGVDGSLRNRTNEVPSPVYYSLHPNDLNPNPAYSLSYWH